MAFRRYLQQLNSVQKDTGNFIICCQILQTSLQKTANLTFFFLFLSYQSSALCTQTCIDRITCYNVASHVLCLQYVSFMGCQPLYCCYSCAVIFIFIFEVLTHIIILKVYNLKYSPLDECAHLYYVLIHTRLVFVQFKMLDHKCSCVTNYAFDLDDYKACNFIDQQRLQS
ncbi:unnamed protein product (macronuclear) [Paramecium tetraurelia]|uniref:Transmembrane protein n=1 Tax=Paramecium tetraurelia TaxID=5888 RepID=A0DDL9_PARTE|nr:uncharacterized protein GSPATT00039443001 [Paramecium tetraurelia]CAK81136.1 unnamed protein product [Paramecium tetraurelia]|eukprot:XP_001448533.1 hypothetical protein (macronuclear) [Paramecium tetraurelia strain d4-2]